MAGVEQPQHSEERHSLPDPLEAHYTTIVKALTEGRVIPFLGAGVNLWGRTAQAQWRRGVELPSGRDLSLYLAKEFSTTTRFPF